MDTHVCDNIRKRNKNISRTGHEKNNKFTSPEAVYGIGCGSTVSTVAIK